MGKSTSCTIPVKNAGNITAKVNLRIEGDSKQFSVKPAQLRVKPEEVRNSESSITINYNWNKKLKKLWKMKIWQCCSDSYLELHLIVFKESEVQVVFQPTEGDKQVERYVLFVFDMIPTGLPLNWRQKSLLHITVYIYDGQTK